MCLSALYFEGEKEPKAQMKNIISAKITEDGWLFTDLMGKVLRVNGEMRKIDFSAGEVWLAPQRIPERFDSLPNR